MHLGRRPFRHAWVFYVTAATFRAFLVAMRNASRQRPIQLALELHVPIESRVTRRPQAARSFLDGSILSPVCTSHRRLRLPHVLSCIVKIHQSTVDQLCKLDTGKRPLLYTR